MLIKTKLRPQPPIDNSIKFDFIKLQKTRPVNCRSLETGLFLLKPLILYARNAGV